MKNKATQIIRNTAVNIGRLLMAATFIFSGYVKAIDPLGTQYKLADYLQAMGTGSLLPEWTLLVGAVLLAALEFSLGIFLLFAIRRHLVSKIVLALMSIMTLLTLWIVIANPVKDCGCFGDAVVLSNGQTFIKNIILLAIALMLLKWPTSMVRFVSKKAQWIVINYTVIFALALSAWSLWDLPLFDFRPYHVGANIAQGMKIPQGAPQPQFETTFILEKNGQQKEFTLDNYPDSTWTFVDSKTVQTAEGYVPPIHDFSIQDNKTGEDITQEVLNDTGYTFLSSRPPCLRRRFQLRQNRPDIRVRTRLWLSVHLSHGKFRQGHRQMAGHHRSRISLLHYRCHNPEDDDKKQPRTDAPAPWNHHTEMEPQQAATARGTQSALGEKRIGQDAIRQHTTQDPAHAHVVCAAPHTPRHRRQTMGLDNMGEKEEREC